MFSSGVVLISIPTGKHEEYLIKKIKKRNTTNERVSEFPQPQENCKIECQSNYQSMEQIIRQTLTQLDVTNSTWTKTEDKNHYQIMFSVENGDKCEEILEILKKHDIGHKLNSTINILPCSVHFHGSSVKEDDDYLEEEQILDKNDNQNNNVWSTFISSVKSRLIIAQVVDSIKARATITFDFIVLLFISTVLCAIGLIENDSIYMLSSMLMSPMMGPVMAGTFGFISKDMKLLKMGIRNEFIGLAFATLVGYFFGIFSCLTIDQNATKTWPTHEMYTRGITRCLIIGSITALLSGAAVALGVLSDNITSLVGVAISSSLMPPAVNAGILWSFVTVCSFSGNMTSFQPTNFYSTNPVNELMTLGAISICLTFVNIICIFIAAICVFKIKAVSPHVSKVKFWDINFNNNYNGIQNLTSTTQSRKNSTYLTNFGENFPTGYHRMSYQNPLYTWSPCTQKVNLLPELQKINNSLLKPRNRRLSEIFHKSPIEDDKLNIICSTISEKTPLLKADALGQRVANNVKKFVVTPSESDPLYTIP